MRSARSSSGGVRRPRAPDAVLLRRFGYARAVGGAVWTAVVVLLVARFGGQALPLLLGVPVLVIVTTLYFARSLRYPRTMVSISLVADAVVLASAIAFFGGTGSGLVSLYAIVVMSAGLLLGPASAVGFTVLGVLLGLGQLGIEELGWTPHVLHRADLGDRVRVLLASGAGLVSVGYLAATYAGRLHELIAAAGEQADDVRARGRRRRRYVAQAGEQVQERLAELESLASALETPAGVDDDRRAQLAARVRIGVGELDAAVSELADAAALDRVGEVRPEPVRLRPVVDDCIRALGDRLEAHVVSADVEAIRVVGDRRTARRIVFNLLENVADHTPPGTAVHVAARGGAGQAVLAVTDDGPGVPADRVAKLFEPAPRGHATVGLPLVRELCELMGASIRYEPARAGGSRFVVTFRIAPSGAPEGDEAPRVDAGG